MSELRGLASYKKKDGTLTVTDGGQMLQWVPSAAAATVAIPIGRITNLQATPPTSAKVMIKVFVSQEGESTVEQFVFTFTSPTTAREEAEAIKDGLTSAIQAYKTAGSAPPETPAASKGDNGRSDTQATAADKGGEYWTKAQLESNMELQQELLASSPELQKIFHETVVLGQLTMNNFWSSRMHLLRAFAAEKAQVKGPYNVLATIKLKIEENVTKLNLSREQIQQIFEQHPLIKKCYDETVPNPLSEDAFWSRLILSRLFKKLKGERLTAQDPHDDVLDQYLRQEDVIVNEPSHEDISVPNIINLEGNEENHSQRKGNQPDLTMRPSKAENVPIIRTLNSLSNKIMERVVPSYKQMDVDDVDRRYMDELRIVDLETTTLEERIMLNIHDQQRFFDSSSEKRDGTTEGEATKAATSASLSDGVKFLHQALGTGSIDLAQAVGDVEGNGEGGEQNGNQVSNGLAAAAKQVISRVQTRRSQMSVKGSKSLKDGMMDGLSEDSFHSAKLTSATTNEFLRQFWDAFLSGDSKRANEVSGMVTSLKRSLERIEAVADTAEKEKLAHLERLMAQQELREREWKKKKRRKIENEAGGGKITVLQMINPHAVDVALKRYEQALAQAGPDVA